MGEAKRRKTANGTLSHPAMIDRLIRRAYSQTCAAFEATPDDDLKALLTSYSGRNLAYDMQAKTIPNGSIGCGDKCSACCHQMVLCAPFEVFVLAQSLFSRRNSDELTLLTERFRSTIHLPLTASARFGRQFPCPLLVDNRCSVYDRRPMACRAMYSSSRQRCEDALASNGGQIAYLGDAQMMATALDLGIACALKKKRGFDIEKVEMNGALLIALERFDESLELWLKGGSPFAAFQVRRANDPTNAELVEIVCARLGL